MILCRDCKHCKSRPTGIVSCNFICDCMPKRKQGVQPWKDKVHPRCPLKENKKITVRNKEKTDENKTYL